MKVIAIAPGYYSHVRIKPGQVFEMPESDMKQVDGQPVLPKWVVTADQEVPSKKGLKLPGAKVVKSPKGAGGDDKGKGEGKGEGSSTGDSDVI